MTTADWTPIVAIACPILVSLIHLMAWVSHRYLYGLHRDIRRLTGEQHDLAPLALTVAIAHLEAPELHKMRSLGVVDNRVKWHRGQPIAQQRETWDELTTPCQAGWGEKAHRFTSAIRKSRRSADFAGGVIKDRGRE